MMVPSTLNVPFCRKNNWQRDNTPTTQCLSLKCVYIKAIIIWVSERGVLLLQVQAL